eukprot:458231-Prorocentrum_minimum.AAC.4
MAFSSRFGAHVDNGKQPCFQLKKNLENRQAALRKMKPLSDSATTHSYSSLSNSAPADMSYSHTSNVSEKLLIQVDFTPTMQTEFKVSREVLPRTLRAARLLEGGVTGGGDSLLRLTCCWTA